MTRYPRVRFKVSSTEDERVFREFLRYYHTPSERLFRWVVQSHPELKRSFWDKPTPRGRILELARKYIRTYYRIHGAEILRSAKEFETRWCRKEEWFYRTVARLFNKKPWPKEAYIGYLTIWGLFPRYLERKTFQVPYRHRIRNYALIVTAHEMLHFIFYDYLFHHYPESRSRRYEMEIWHASEIFNAIVQRSKPWVKTFGSAPMVYPEHRPAIRRIGKRWQPQDGVETFLNIALIPRLKEKD